MTDTNDAGRPAENAANSAQPTAPARLDDSATPEQIAELVARLSSENTEQKDRLLRTLAEMENLRRRTEREVADARLYGVTSFARDMVGVADNMRRALDAVTAETRAGADAGVAALIEGVELTERELLKTLEKNGVKKLEPMGEKFDPNFHQAMYEIPDPSVPAGIVVQVVQAGYKIGERVLRPALVAIAKGGAKESAKADAANDNAGAATGN
jgi:molecular chaperone GrpE